MIAALVGGQFGSEGKGLIAGHIARDYKVHVRVGAANAGHTLYTHHRYSDDDPMTGITASKVRTEKHVMQQLPCAAYANPDALLVIGPGALISSDIFLRELEAWREWLRNQGRAPGVVYVDKRAHVITAEHIQREAESDLAARIGSTSTIAREGIGAAQAARIMREASCLQASECPVLRTHDMVKLADVPRLLESVHLNGLDILLEGTQGTGLSLTTGQFPYTTSRNTTAAGLAADVGVPPRAVERVILVCRSYPIRVAGNSGPFHRDSAEIDWHSLGVDPESERTTVTKKVRRVATFSIEQVRESCWLNGATEVALTFADYLDPEVAGRADAILSSPGEHPAIWNRIASIEHVTHRPVRYVGTGPYSVVERPSAPLARAAA